MSDHSDNPWMVYLAAGVIGMLLVGGALGYLFMSSNATPVAKLARTSSTSTSTPRVSITRAPARPTHTVQILPDPADPTAVGEIHFNGHVYAPDEPGYAALTEALKALPKGARLELRAQSDLSAQAVHNAMGAIAVTDLDGTIELTSYPDAHTAAEWSKN